jgi:hypothetical protein
MFHHLNPEVLVVGPPPPRSGFGPPSPRLRRGLAGALRAEADEVSPKRVTSQRAEADA